MNEGMANSVQDAEYTAVNSALNKVIFSGRFESQPVFMVLDPASKAAVAKLLAWDEDEVETYICCEVGKALSKVGDPYSPLETRLRPWRCNGMETKPPFTALLFCLSHAAELMASDGQYTNGNYYVRLSALTGLPRKQLGSHGRETAKYWHWLAKWLASNDYRYGRPTARAINQFKYVSIPMSQAIVRAGDRKYFHDMFERYGFSGGYNVSEAEIERYVDSWIRSSASNQRLRQAWSRREFRPRMCEIVLAELEEWSSGKGEFENGASQQASNLSLALAVVPRFPDRVAALSLGFHGEVDKAIRLGEDGEHALTLDNNVYGSFATLSPANQVPLGELLLKGASYESSDQQTCFKWRYRAVLPFVRAESGPFWIETNKTAIGAKNLLLVRDCKHIRAAVEALLEEISAPGYTVATPTHLQGIPIGWVLYENVCILRLPDDELPDSNLWSLVPIARSAGLKPVGGLRLSKKIWHRREPPSIHLEVSEGPCRIAIFEGVNENGDEIQSINSPGSKCEIDLLNLVPASGDIFALGFEENKKVGHIDLLCRTAKRPRLLKPDEIDGFQYVSAIFASRRVTLESANKHPNHQNGEPLPPADAILGKFQKLDGEGEEERGLTASPLTPVRYGSDVDIKDILAKSCGERGSHYWICETVPQGGKPGMPLQMECRDCKLSVLTENRGKKPLQKEKTKTLPVPAPPKRPETVEAIDPDLLLDALCFLGQGTWGAFESLVAQHVAEPWEAVNLAKSFEALGYLDLARTRGAGKITHWAVPAPTLYLTSDGRALLRGFRNTPLVEKLGDTLLASGARDASTACNGQPRSIAFEAVDLDLAAVLASDNCDPHKRSLELILDAPRAFARRLQVIHPATDILDALSVADDVGAERYDLQTGKWSRCADTLEPGAYRFAWRGQSYAYRAARDTSLFQGPHEIVKLLAARNAGRNLHAYLADDHTFVVRLGAEPTGLVARALCACNGLLPEREGTVLNYGNVPPDIASAILNSLYPHEVHDENC